MILLNDSRFNDGMPVATDTAPGLYDPSNIADLRPNKKHKFAGAGTKYYTVDTGASKAASMLGVKTHNLGSSSALVSVESGPGVSVFDQFNDASFDTAKFGSAIAGTGSLIENLTRLELISGGGNNAVMVWDKIVSRRHGPYTVDLKSNILPAAGASLAFGIYQFPISPIVDTASSLVDVSELKVWIEYDISGFIRIVFRDADGNPNYWDGDKWIDTAFEVFEPNPANIYLYRLINNGRDLTIQVWDFAETILYVSAVVSLSVIEDDGYDDYFLWGDISSDINLRASMFSYLYDRFGEGGVYTERLAPFTPADDKGFLKAFAEASDRFWRVKIVTATDAAYAGSLQLGQPLEFPKPPDVIFDPNAEDIEGWENVSRDGCPVGSGIRYRPRTVTAKWSRLSRDWLMDTFKPVYDADLSDLEPFMFVWDINDVYAEVLFGWLPKTYIFQAPIAVLDISEDFELQILAVKE